MGAMTAAVVGGALLGGIAGSQRDKKDISSTQSVNVGPATQSETNATKSIDDIFKQLQGFTSSMPGSQDIQNSTNSQRDLAAMLKEFAAGNFGPTGKDFELANLQTQPQQVALDQALRDAQMGQQRQAALLGRGGNDFTFANKLNQNRLDSYQMLGAQRSAIASQLPMQRLGFQQQLANVQGGLATQALQNRTAILSLGQQIQNAERNFRLNAASKTTTGQEASGGGMGGFLTGAIAGAGTAYGVGNYFNGAGGGAASSAGASPFNYSGNNYLGGASLANQFAPASQQPMQQSRLGFNSSFFPG